MTKAKQKGNKKKGNVDTMEEHVVPVAPLPASTFSFGGGSLSSAPVYSVKSNESEFIQRNNDTLLSRPGHVGSVVVNVIDAHPVDAKRKLTSVTHDVCPEPKLFYLGRTLLVRNENKDNHGNDLYGRNIFNIRHMYTNNDLEPLECTTR